MVVRISALSGLCSRASAYVCAALWKSPCTHQKQEVLLSWHSVTRHTCWFVGRCQCSVLAPGACGRCQAAGQRPSENALAGSSSSSSSICSGRACKLAHLLRVELPQLQVGGIISLQLNGPLEALLRPVAGSCAGISLRS
jgi:hypothetical protein